MVSEIGSGVYRCQRVTGIILFQLIAVVNRFTRTTWSCLCAQLSSLFASELQRLSGEAATWISTVDLIEWMKSCIFLPSWHRNCRQSLYFWPVPLLVLLHLRLRGSLSRRLPLVSSSRVVPWLDNTKSGEQWSTNCRPVNNLRTFFKLLEMLELVHCSLHTESVSETAPCKVANDIRRPMNWAEAGAQHFWSSRFKLLWQFNMTCCVGVWTHRPCIWMVPIVRGTILLHLNDVRAPVACMRSLLYAVFMLLAVVG